MPGGVEDDVVPDAVGQSLAAGVEGGGTEAFTRASAKQLTPEIRGNVIAPRFVITPQNEDTYVERAEKRRRIDERTPLGRVADRAEIVGAVVYLPSDAASHVAGEVATVDARFADSAL
nr:SDR family oxidoreductase [Halegenticoccus soli]